MIRLLCLIKVRRSRARTRINTLMLKTRSSPRARLSRSCSTSSRAILVVGSGDRPSRWADNHRATQLRQFAAQLSTDELWRVGSNMNTKIDIGLVDLNNTIEPPRKSTAGIMDQSQGLAIFRVQFAIDTEVGGKDLYRAGRHQI